MASAEVCFAIVAAHWPKFVRQAFTVRARRHKLSGSAVEASKVIHGTANGHEDAHADRVDDGGERDPSCHPTRVRLDAQDEDAADDDAEAHHQDSTDTCIKHTAFTQGKILGVEFSDTMCAQCEKMRGKTL